jgi:hypothetical protein
LSGSNHVSVEQLEPNEIAYAKVIAGVSPSVLRRVFGSWILFVCIIGVVVSLAPDISIEFLSMTFIVLFLFSVMIFFQSRISEGWPSVIIYERKLGVVKDPQAREFIFVSKALIKDALPIEIPQNKKAVEIKLKPALLTSDDLAVLRQGIWPRDDSLLAMTYFKKRQLVVADIIEFSQPS